MKIFSKTDLRNNGTFGKVSEKWYVLKMFSLFSPPQQFWEKKD
jgi:hypothetical protein